MLEPHAAPDSITACGTGAPRLRSVPQSAEPRSDASRLPLDEARDAALLAAVALEHDQAAFEELYRRHVRAVTAAALHICHDAGVAEEIAQRTFIVLWERALRLTAKTVRLRPWLVTVARNAAIDHLRAESAYVAPSADCGDAHGSACPQDQAITNALIADLGPALEALPSAQRTVIELRYFQGASFPNIAELVGEPLETVKSRARLGIERLRRAMV